MRSVVLLHSETMKRGDPQKEIAECWPVKSEATQATWVSIVGQKRSSSEWWLLPSSNPAQYAKDLKARIGFDALHKDNLGGRAMCTHPDWSKLMGEGAERLGMQISTQWEMDEEDKILSQTSGWKVRGQSKLGDTQWGVSRGHEEADTFPWRVCGVSVLSK